MFVVPQIVQIAKIFLTAIIAIFHFIKMKHNNVRNVMFHVKRVLILLHQIIVTNAILFKKVQFSILKIEQKI